MRYITMTALIIASTEDIKTLETDPVLLIFCMAGRILEMLIKGERMTDDLILTGIVFLVLMTGCVCYSMGGADALVGALICLNLGERGICALVTGFLMAIPYMAYKKGKEIPLIPFLSAGYILWLFL